MEILDIKKELAGNAYPGRGIVIGKSADGVHAVIAYFIMGRSVNSRNRVFVEQGDGIRTEAFDPAKLSDPSPVIYAPVRVLANKTIVTNGDQTDTVAALGQRHHRVAFLDPAALVVVQIRLIELDQTQIETELLVAVDARQPPRLLARFQPLQLVDQ